MENRETYRPSYFLYLILCCSLLLFACPSQENSATNDKNKPLRVGFIPSENMAELQQNVQPLVSLMSKALDREVEPFIATDYTGIVEAFRSGQLDTAFLSPASYVMAKSEADVKVILKAERGKKPFYYAIVFTHKDNKEINTIEHLKGKTFAFSDSLSTAGYIYPLKMLKGAGINPSTDFENLIFSGGHDATVLAVFNKKVTAGATYANNETGSNAAWIHLLKPEESQKLKVIAVSEAIPADNICVSKTLDKKTAKSIETFFTGLSKEPKGQAMIKNLYRIDRFVPATDSDYKGIREAFELSGIELKDTQKKAH